MSAPPDTTQQNMQVSEGELAAILNRFQSWTKGSTGRQNSASRVRELSYEEALRRNVYRAHESLPDLAASNAPNAEAIPEAAAGRTSAKGCGETTVAAPDAPGSPEFLHELNLALSQLQLNARPEEVAATEMSEASPPSLSGRAGDKASPEVAGGVAAGTSPDSSAKLRSVPLTIRVTAVEHARIRSRAMAAKVSVSAYLRWCAFEVEKLQAQLAEAKAPPVLVPDELAPILNSSRPGIFARLVNRWRGGDREGIYA